jgi:aminopeptidase N
MGLHRSALADAEKAVQKPESAASESLINTTDEEFYRSKAMLVWWMLRDMVGEAALKRSLAAYRPQADQQPSYLQQLVQAESKRDLEWFFDDWVYRDRGLPDFRIASVYPRKTLGEAYVVTVTVENRGEAGAEVPLTLRTAEGDVTKRLEVRGKSTASIRIEVPSLPQEAVVNDGSVPASEAGNNIFKIEAAK